MAATTRMGITNRQRDCFDVIQTHIARHRSAPSCTEIAVAMGLKSKGQVSILLQGLRDRGWVTYQIGRKRSLAIVEGGGAPLYTLPWAVEEALRMHCTANGEDPASVVADAVALFLDELEAKQAA